ncbi:MAG TPA: ABC transporter substrate-binding protein [Candidatus Binatia bacterium]|jgi:ABC-type uncharacterized transport system substrate-binding protein
MGGRAFYFAFCALLFTVCVSAEAQQQVKVAKIGWLGARSASAPAVELFRRELHALGYVEGKNLALEYRYAEGKLDRLPVEVSSAERFEGAFKEAIQARSAALALMGSPFFYSNQKQIVDLAAKHHLPAIYTNGEFVVSGGLMSYGVDEAEPYRRVAVYVDEILKGAKPANLPVEQPTKFELALNLKTAKALGLTIPPIVLTRATRVVK